jgi:hypothetical protein
MQMLIGSELIKTKEHTPIDKIFFGYRHLLYNSTSLCHSLVLEE